MQSFLYRQYLISINLCTVGDPGLGRPPGGGHGNPLQFLAWRIPIDRGAGWATVLGVTKSWTQLNI